MLVLRSKLFYGLVIDLKLRIKFMYMICCTVFDVLIVKELILFRKRFVVGFYVRSKLEGEKFL